MNPLRTWFVARKDLRLGPRSPIFLYALVMPVVATLMVSVVFGSLFAPQPRLGIVDHGQSVLSEQAELLEGIQVTFLESEDELKTRVEDNGLDAGLILQEGFDQALTAQENPQLNFFIGGESLASNRVIIAVTAFDLVRGAAGSASLIDVDIETIGDDVALPVSQRLVPMLVMLAVIIAGLFVPAASLVEEKEHDTLNAVLVTPTQMPDVLAAKGLIGFVLAVATAIVTLILNNAFSNDPVALLLVIVIAALMAVEFGLILGSWAPDSNTLFTVAKGGNFFLMLPVFFFLWPGLPQWIPKLMPTYYFLSPLFSVAIEGASLADVLPELAIAGAVCVALMPVVLFMGRRMESVLASE